MRCEQPQYRLVVRGVSQIHQPWEKRRVKRYGARLNNVEGYKDWGHRLMGQAIKNMLHKRNLGNAFRQVLDGLDAKGRTRIYNDIHDIAKVRSSRGYARFWNQ